MKKRRNAYYIGYIRGDGSTGPIPVGGRKEMKYKLRYLSLFLIRSTALLTSPCIRTLGRPEDSPEANWPNIGWGAGMRTGADQEDGHFGGV